MPEPVVHVAGPGEVAPEAYYATRYAVLREPLGRPPGSERLPDDDRALHVWVEVNGALVAVARGHLIEGDGAAADHSGPGAAKIPSFRRCVMRPPISALPCKCGRWASSSRGAGPVLGRWPWTTSCGFRPRVGRKTGWLQAREAAVGFYARMGWRP
ncbi:MAG: hypothetical protein CM15mP79_2680 [Methanobacteriota archaeon]|nr:MAG: hypothetical protein CM15mP79_2680 [Euryarchaeota archaeon]